MLALLAEGLSDADIAARLVIEVRTVKSHTNTLYSKLGVTSRTQAALLVLTEQLRQAHATTTELRGRIAAAQAEIDHMSYFLGRAVELMTKLGKE